MDTQEIRDFMIEAVARAFTRDVLSQAAFESLVTEIGRINDPMILEALVRGRPEIFGTLAPLGPVVPAANPGMVWKEWNRSLGDMKQTGQWVEADAYQIYGKFAEYLLDFSAYDGCNGFRLLLQVDLSFSTLKLIVPDGWAVNCEIDANTAGEVKDDDAESAWGDNLIEIRGSLMLAEIKVKHR